jgi:phosphate/phosphite/phosphonate ABC transporter binding protein
MFIRILLLVLIANCAFAQVRKSDTLVFATYQYSTNNRIKNIEPFAKHFSEVTGHPVKVRSYGSVHALIDGMKNSEAHIVFINTFGYMLLREQSSAYSIAAALHVPETARSTYQTAIVSNVKTNIRALKDITHQNIKPSLLLVNPGSTSGNLIPRLAFTGIGITEPEKFFSTIEYAKNHALTLQNVIDGKADIGAFGIEEYHKAVEKDSSVRNMVNLIWESDPIPLGPAVYSKELSKEISQKLVASLLNLHREDKQALESIKAGWTEAIPADKFQIVDEGHYNTLIRSNPKEGMKIIRAFAQ